MFQRAGLVLVVVAAAPGCVGLYPLGLLFREHLDTVERQPTVEFVNDLSVAVCDINLWRDAGPAADQTANWLELTDVRSLAPGARVTVGLQPRDAPYHLRAVDCEGEVRVEALVQVVAGRPLHLQPGVPSGAQQSPPPVPAPL
jgi:hypothetical protein